MHSGTHLMKDLIRFKKIGAMPDSMFYPPDDPRDFMILFHLVDGHGEYYRIAEKYKKIIPMRHPVRILESMRRRGLGLANLEEQFRNLQRVHEFGNKRYIHVDSPDRDEHVRAVGKWLNRAFNPTWPRLTVKHTIDFEVTDERIAEIPEWIMAFYQSI